MGHLRLVHSLPSAPAPAHPCLEAFRCELDFLHEALRRLGRCRRFRRVCLGSDAHAPRYRASRPAPARYRPRARDRPRAGRARNGSDVRAAPVSRGRGRRLGVAATVCLAFAVGAAGATAALHDRGWRSHPVDALPSAAAAPPSTKIAETDPAPADPLVSAGPVTVIRPRRPPRSQVPAHRSYAAELECLERAQVAFAGRDFRGALAASAEHARRFSERLARRTAGGSARAVACRGGACRPKRAAPRPRSASASRAACSCRAFRTRRGRRTDPSVRLLSG